jgi:hypothetical protein
MAKVVLEADAAERLLKMMEGLQDKLDVIEGNNNKPAESILKKPKDSKQSKKLETTMSSILRRCVKSNKMPVINYDSGCGMVSSCFFLYFIRAPHLIVICVHLCLQKLWVVQTCWHMLLSWWLLKRATNTTYGLITQLILRRFVGIAGLCMQNISEQLL